MKEKMNGWAVKEFKTLDLEDTHPNKQAILLDEQLGADPRASIPNGGGSWAETAAAYRFLNHEKLLPWQDIMSPHWHASVRRIRACEVVLCLQDTTELSFNVEEMEKLGPLS